MDSQSVHAFTNENFDFEVLQSDRPVLVDFSADWCCSCRTIGPVIDQLAQELDGNIKVGKVNVDQSSAVASRYGIQSIPTILLFVGGEPRETIVGAVPKGRLLQRLRPHIRAS